MNTIGKRHYFLLISPVLLGITIVSFNKDNAKITKDITSSMNLPSEELNKELLKKMSYFNIFFPIGGFIGAMLSPILLINYGRKYTTIFILQLLAISSCVNIISTFEKFWFKYLSRFFYGVGAGGLMVSSTVWYFDIIPNLYLRYSNPFIQVCINFGLLVGGVFTMESVDKYDFNLINHLISLLSIVASFIYLYIPESPKFVYYHSQDENHLKKQIGKTCPDKLMAREMQNIILEHRINKEKDKTLFRTYIVNRKYLASVLSICIFNVCAQTCGIDIAVSFIRNLYEHYTIPIREDAYMLIHISTILLGSIMFIYSAAKYNRKMLILISFGLMACTMAVSSLLYAYDTLPLCQVIFFSIFTFVFQIGPGPLHWCICSEIFPSHSLPLAQGVTTALSWAGKAFIFCLFPFLYNYLQLKILYLLAVSNIINLLLMFCLIINTNDMPPYEILHSYYNKWRNLSAIFSFKVHNTDFV